MSEIDFVAIFRTQVEGQLSSASDLALQLENSVKNGEDIQSILESLMREFHTIKGASRAIQFNEIKEVAHQIEDIYHALINKETEIRMPDLTNLTLQALDSIEQLLEARINGEPQSGHEVIDQQVKDYLSGKALSSQPDAAAPQLEQAEQTEQVEPADQVEQTEAQTSTDSSPAETPPIAAEAEAVAESNTSPSPSPAIKKNDFAQQDQLTDSLLTVSGEFSVAIDGLTDQRQMMRSDSQRLEAIQRDIGIFLAQLTEKIELAGIDAPIEKMNELQKRIRSTLKHQNESIDSLDQTQSRLHFLGDSLRDEVTRARLVPLSNLFSNYSRIVRDLSQELGKQCQISISGELTRIDRAVMEAVRVPLIHLLRNSLDHGLESPEQRAKLGKPAVGSLQLDAVQLGGQIRITLEDDGCGIELDNIGKKVIQRGDTTAELWQAMTQQEQEQFLFLPGFSTAKTVTDTSGRGFGLDIVKTEVEKVSGRVSLQPTKSGVGTCVVLELPLTLSLTRCLMVSGGQSAYFGQQIYAFPVNEVGEIRRIHQDDLRIVETKTRVRVDDMTLPLEDFSYMMGLQPIHEKLENKHLLIIGEGAERSALLVDEVFDEQDVVTRPFDSRIGKLHDMQGVTLLRNGGVALIVDVVDLLQSMHDRHGGLVDNIHKTSELKENQLHENDSVICGSILVVEDSATVREVERHMLEQEGYTVVTAVNGIDGFNKLRAGNFDLIVSDIDMPRMNGVDMIIKIRAVDNYKELPIIVVSYKDREQDRLQAIDAGANHYVTKAAFDSGEMMEKIKELIN